MEGVIHLEKPHKLTGSPASVEYLITVGDRFPADVYPRCESSKKVLCQMGDLWVHCYPFNRPGLRLIARQIQVQ